MEPQFFYYALAGLLVVVGILGTVLPALPGLPLVFAGMFLAAWAGGFAQVGVGTLVVLGVLTALSLLVDLWATAVGAQRVGASRLAIVGAIVGTVLGLFFGLLGLLVGPFVGALAGELAHGRSLARQRLGHAARVGVGTWVGIAFGIALKLAIGFSMIGIFALAWWL